jgi:hypothetical protein
MRSEGIADCQLPIAECGMNPLFRMRVTDHGSRLTDQDQTRARGGMNSALRTVRHPRSAASLDSQPSAP